MKAVQALLSPQSCQGPHLGPTVVKALINFPGVETHHSFEAEACCVSLCLVNKEAVLFYFPQNWLGV